MAKSKPTGRYLHYEPERTDYAVSDLELEKLGQGERSIWKDVFLVTLALAVPTLTNAIVAMGDQDQFKITLSIFLNTVIGIISLFICVIAFLAWRQQRREFSSVVEAIKKKPRFEISPGILAKEPDPPSGAQSS